MPIAVSRAQEAELDDVARQRFLDNLFDYVVEAFPDDSPSERRTLFEACISACTHEKIVTEYGVNAFVVLSFMAEQCLADDEDFTKAQSTMIDRTGDPERLIELLFESNFPE